MSDQTTEYDGFQNYLYTRMPNRLSKVNQLFEQQVNAVQAARNTMMEVIGVKALTLAPKDSFELRLRCLAFLHPNFDAGQEEEEVDCDVYEYSLSGEGLFRSEDCSYPSYLGEDDRYDVEFGYLEQEDKDVFSQKLILTIKQTKNLFERVPEFDQIFQNGAEKINAAKETFCCIVGAKTLTMSPKESFEARIQALQYLYPRVGTERKPELEDLNDFVYCLSGTELLQSKDLDKYESFVMEDDRYEVIFSLIEKEEDDSWHQYVTLLMKEAKSIDQEGAVTTDMLDQFPELYQICQDQGNTVNETKETFRNEVRAKALTSSPRDSFEARLEALQFLHAKVGINGNPKQTDSNIYEYQLSGKGLFYSDDNDIDGCKSFVIEDDRYDVEFSCIEQDEDDMDIWHQTVVLTIKMEETD
jgi:hypothetical protein